MFREVFPILSYDERLTLEYVSYNLGDPKSTELECLREGITYSVPLYVKLSLREEDFIKDEDIYMGEIPMVLSASISWFTCMVPNWAAKAPPVRPAMTIPVA